MDVRTAPGGKVSDHGPHSAPAPAADGDLVSAFHEGDPSAYPEIYRRNRPLADRVCRRLLCNLDDAEEAAQETMLRVLQGLPRFDGNHLKAWVARIATNVCLDVLRSRARRVENVESIPLDPGNGGNADDDPFEVVQRLAEEGRVHSLLARLCQEQRAALVLREFHGLSHREIGLALGKSPAQVKALIHRARGSFRRTWDREGRARPRLMVPPAASSGNLPAPLRTEQESRGSGPLGLASSAPGGLDPRERAWLPSAKWRGRSNTSVVISPAERTKSPPGKQPSAPRVVING